MFHIITFKITLFSCPISLAFGFVLFKDIRSNGTNSKFGVTEVHKHDITAEHRIFQLVI